MTLEKREIPIPIGGGIDEGTSDVLFEAPLLREGRDIRIEKTGAIGKRLGEDALPATLPSTSTYGEHNAIAEVDGRALVLSQLGAYVHDAARASWTSSGAVQPRPSHMRCDALVRANNSILEPEIALVTVNSRTLACVVWVDAETYEGFYMWALVPSDASPLRPVSGPTQFGNLARKMSFQIRLATIGTTVYAVGASGDDHLSSDTFATKCDAALGYTFAAVGINAWGISSVPVALLSDGSAALWVVLDELAGPPGAYSIRKLDTSFAQTASQTGINRDALDAIRSGTTIVVLCGNGSVDQCADSLAAPPVNHAIVGVNAATGPLYTNTQRGTICEAGAGTFFAAFERMASTVPVLDQGVVIASISAGYAPTAIGTVGTLRIAGRAAYSAADGVPLLPCLDSIDETLWRMGYVTRPTTDASGVYTLTEVGRFGQDVTVRQGTGRTISANGTAVSKKTKVVASIARDGASGQWLMPYAVVSDSTRAYLYGPKLGIDILRLRTTDAPALRNVQGQRLRIFAGGCGPSYSDGILHAEITPPPVLLIDDPPNSGGGSDPSGMEYNNGGAANTPVSIILAPRWRDARGNLHRAPPLKAETLTLWDTAIAPDLLDDPRRIRFPRPFPNSIRGEKGGQSYELEVYCGGFSADGPFYLLDVVTPQPHPVHAGVDYIVISFNTTFPNPPGTIQDFYRTDGADHIADVRDPALGTDGLVQRWTDVELAHVPPPAAIDVCSTQERVWLLSAEGGRLEVFPSKLLTPGYAPEFPPALRIVLPDEGGEATAIAALGDRVIVFKERSLYAIFGSPGDNTGAGGNVTVRLIPADVGCREPQSVVQGPFGVVFRSAAGGFHLLSPGESVQRLPQLEDTLADWTITSGALVADQRQVRWSALDPGKTTRRTLVWDYEANAWLTHSHGFGTVHGTTVGGAYARIAAGGSVLVERETFSTSLDAHKAKITSAWLKLTGAEVPQLVGFKRVWKAVFLVRWYSGKVIVRIGVDYGESFVDERIWDEAAMAALAAATPNAPIVLVVHLTRQKVMSVRFQLEEDRTGGQFPEPVGQGFTLLGASLEAGFKRGSAAHKVAAAAKK